MIGPEELTLTARMQQSFLINGISTPTVRSPCFDNC
jgi:hypothetical protein